MRADTVYACPHTLKHPTQVEDFRFAGRTFDAGASWSKNGSHKGVCSARYRAALPATKEYGTASQVSGVDTNVTFSDICLRP
jgi:hypothetical protein